MRLIAVLGVLFVLASCSDSELVFDCRHFTILVSADREHIEIDANSGYRFIVHSSLKRGDTIYYNYENRTYTFNTVKNTLNIGRGSSCELM